MWRPAHIAGGATAQVGATNAWPEAGWDPAAQPSTMMLGVLSSDVRMAVRALRDYADALNLEFVMPKSRVGPARSLLEFHQLC